MATIRSRSKISSVSEFIELILKEHRSGPSLREADISCLTFYRGQTNSSWRLSPRLFREGLTYKERTLIQEMRRLYPSEFDGLGYFDQLVKMQHYGIPTRLLDTTLNPLVALFFACFEEEHINQDGCVFVFPRLPVYRPEHWSVVVSMIYSFEISAQSVNLERTGGLLARIPMIEVETGSQRPQDILKTCVAGWPFTPVIPNHNNRRVQNQDGAFFICNMQEAIKSPELRKTQSRNNSTCFEPRDIQNDLESWEATFSVIIPSQKKISILEELSLIGISRSRLFPELEHQAGLVTQAIKGSTRHD